MIQARNLDFTTLPYTQLSTDRQTISSGTTTQINGLSYTIPVTGKYFVCLNGNAGANGGGDAYPRFRIDIGDSEQFHSAIRLYGDATQMSFSACGVLDVTAGQVVKARASGPVDIFEKCRLIVFRIA